jgi:general secretion pathway protein D
MGVFKTSVSLMRLTAALTVAALMIAAQATALANTQEGQTLNFRDAEIAAVIDDVSRLTGYTFIVDPDVRGRVTITSQSPLTSEEVFQVFLSTLRVNGYAAVRSAPGVFQIVPEAEGARAGAPVGAGRDGEIFLTSVIRLTNTSARDALRAIGPMISGSGAANAVESGNLIVVVDFASNIGAVEQALRAMDVDRSTVEMMVLENIPAEDMVSIVERLRTRTAQGEDDRAFAVTVAAVPASNALLLRGEPGAVGQMVALVRRIDAVSASNQSFRVIYLDHAEGEDLLPILEQFAEALSVGEAADGRPVSIAHHSPTNAIIINASPDLLRELEQVIGRLDIRRPQVQVEAIVVEVSDRAARDLGVQFLLAGNGSDATPFGYTRYGSTSSPDLLALTGALITDSLDGQNGDGAAGASNLRDLAIGSLLGARGGAFGVGGQIGDDGALFGVILNALEADADSNVLSKPQVMVLDNEEASLIVGQEIPITTGETLGSNNTNPFRQIEREDVGVQLIVTPQINDGDTIRLQITQIVSSIAGPVSTDFQELITNNREITTTVLADDGEIIVLGGLIETDEQIALDAVPGLSRIPVAGRLFQSEARSERRRNLMVFIRPVIVRDAEDMRAVTRGAYDDTVNAQRQANEGRSRLEDIVTMMMDGAPAFDRPLPSTDPEG